MQQKMRKEDTEDIVDGRKDPEETSTKEINTKEMSKDPTRSVASSPSTKENNNPTKPKKTDANHLLLHPVIPNPKQDNSNERKFVN